MLSLELILNNLFLIYQKVYLKEQNKQAANKSDFSYLHIVLNYR
jgi:hypothetical protein